MCSVENLPSTLEADPITQMEEMDLNGNCEFFDAVTKGDYFSIAVYLDEGGDIDLVDPFNLKTALFIAVDNNNMNMINFLIKHGASIDHRDASGMTFKEYLAMFW